MNKSTVNASRRLKLVIALLAFGFLTQTALAAQQWPKLDRKTTDFVCLETLKQAQEAFNSNNFNLFEPSPAPADAQNKIILQSKEPDISYGDGVQADESFEKLSLKISGRSESGQNFYHWGKDDTAGWRFVVVSENVGWRGNFYTLYRIDSKLTQDAFLAALGQASGSILPKPMIAQNWRPPMIFRRNDTRAAWAVDVRQTFEVLAPWLVYPANGLKLEPACKVQFAREFRRVADLLPPPVRDLAKSLAAAMGNDGPNPGTLRPFAHLRLKTEVMWGNVAMRPWAALAAKPYNDRKTVDTGLDSWGATGSNAALLRKIKRQYPLAEKALAERYKKEFSKPDGEAKDMAAKVLDLAYRMHFVFDAE